MRVAWVIILSLIATVGTVGCVQTDATVVSNFDRLGGLVFVDPDSVATILDGIRWEDLRDAESRSKYDLLRTIVEDRLGIPHQSLDAILSARDYLVEANASDSLLMIAHLYTGRVYEDLGESEKALESYLTAQSHCQNTTGVHQFKGRIAYNIGYLYHNDYDYAHASSFLEQAIDHFNVEGDSLNAAHSYNLLGANHTVSGKVEEGLDALNRAGEIYGNIRDTDSIMNNILTIAGLYLHNLDDVLKADSVMKRFHKEYNNGIIPRSHMPMMSQIEAGKDNYGKAVELLQNYLVLTPHLPLEKRVAFYSLMSYYDSRMGEYATAYNHISEYVTVMDSLYQDKILTVLREVEKKYEKQTLENEYEAYRKVTLNRILTGSICLLATISVLIVYIRKRRQKHLDLEVDLDRMKSQMNEFDDLKNTLSNVLDQKVEREIRLQEVLTNKILYTQTLIDSLFTYEKRKDEFHEKVTEIIKAGKDCYFGELHEVVNEKYAGIIDHIKRKHPTITDDELNLCCLVSFGFNNNQISIILGYTNVNSIFNKRYKLKNKMGFGACYSTLEAYLLKLISDLRSGAFDCVHVDAYRTND